MVQKIREFRSRASSLEVFDLLATLEKNIGFLHLLPSEPRNALHDLIHCSKGQKELAILVDGSRCIK